MYPLDFEEFLWATDMNEQVIEHVKNCFVEEKAVPEAIHQQFMNLLLQYTVVGGMPNVVETFLQTHNIAQVASVQRNIQNSFR